MTTWVYQAVQFNAWSIVFFFPPDLPKDSINKNNEFPKNMIHTYSLLQNKPTFWHFPLWNGQFHGGKILPRSCAKSPIFSSIAYDNVKTFSMSFGFKILSGYGITSHQILSFQFSILKWSFFHTLNFEALELHHPL